LYAEDVEADSLGKRTALTNSNDVTDLDTESGRAVDSDVLVTLLVPGVLGDEVKVLSSDDDGAGHLGRDDLSGEDTSTDGNETGEGTLLVNVGTLDGLSGGLESETDFLVPATVLTSDLAGGGGNLVVVEQRLLLVRLLNLFGHDELKKGAARSKFQNIVRSILLLVELIQKFGLIGRVPHQFSDLVMVLQSHGLHLVL